MRLEPRLTPAQHQAVFQLEQARGMRGSLPPTLGVTPPPPVFLGSKAAVVSAPKLSTFPFPGIPHHHPAAIRPPPNNQIVQAPRQRSLLDDPDFRQVAQAYFLYPAREAAHAHPKGVSPTIS